MGLQASAQFEAKFTALDMFDINGPLLLTVVVRRIIKKINIFQFFKYV